MKTLGLIALSVAVLAGTYVAAQQPATAAAPGRQRRAPDPRSMGGVAAARIPTATTWRTLPAPNTVWLEEMTWIDVRDAIKAGKTNVIVPTGGMPNRRRVAGHRRTTTCCMRTATPSPARWATPCARRS